MARYHRERSKKRPQPPPIQSTERKRAGRPCTPLIPIGDESSLGRAMLALPPAQRAFVVAKVMFGMSNTDAAQVAGYSARSPNALGVVGSRLAHDERIQAALLEEGQKLMRSEGPRSIHTLVAIRDDVAADKKDRMKAAVELLNRSGFSAVTQHNISVEHHLSDAEKDTRILALCAEMGLGETEARKMLIAPDKIIEGDFSVVETPSAPLTKEDARAAAKRDRENAARRLRRRMTPDELGEHRERVKTERVARLKAKYAEHTAATETTTEDDLADFLAIPIDRGTEPTKRSERS